MRATNAGRDSSRLQGQQSAHNVDSVVSPKVMNLKAQRVARAEVVVRRALKKSAQGHAASITSALGISMC